MTAASSGVNLIDLPLTANSPRLRRSAGVDVVGVVVELLSSPIVMIGAGSVFDDDDDDGADDDDDGDGGALKTTGDFPFDSKFPVLELKVLTSLSSSIFRAKQRSTSKSIKNCANSATHNSFFFSFVGLVNIES